MAGSLYVLNPRRKHRRRRRVTGRRKVARRRRRRVTHAIAAYNPRRRRRSRRAHARRHVRRRRHNPRLPAVGGYIKPLMAGAGVGVGIYAVNLAVKAWNNNVKQFPLTGMMETVAKAVAGLVVLPLVLKAVKAPTALVQGVTLGGGAVVALDLLEQYVTPSLPASLHGYSTISGYSSDQISGGAQGGMYSGQMTPNKMY